MLLCNYCENDPEVNVAELFWFYVNDKHVAPGVKIKFYWKTLYIKQILLYNAYFNKCISIIIVLFNHF